MKITTPRIILFVGTWTAMSCSSPSNNDPVIVSPTVTAEIDFCSTNTTYASPVIVNGTASFYKRGLAVTTSAGVVTEMTLATSITTPLPIKFAEVRVLNSAGSIIQCGQTNATGQLKALNGTSNLEIPNTAGSYTVEVLSRSSHVLDVPSGKTAFNFVTSVKKDIYSNEVYKVSAAVTSTGTGTVTANVTAYALESQSADVIGGSFNIYNNILTAYEYLAANTALSNLTCMNPKLHVYWKVGFNPAQYLYPNSNPSDLSTLSFYVRGDNKLYINGGQLGNIQSVDTDHFDDSVIIHELGHHIEDVCGKMDSPGGQHYGLYRIDPRLAWSEGWGNFFGAHILKNNTTALNPDLAAQLPSSGWTHYLDTKGYNDGTVTTGDSLILINLTKPGNNPECVYTPNGTRCYDAVNSASNPGEGHTREISISRSLFKSTNTCTSLCSNANYFDFYWKAFENDSAGIGMGKSIYPFRSSARFYSRLNQSFTNAGTTTPATINSILNSDEAQQLHGNANYTVSGFNIWVPYGIKLISNGGTACPTGLKIQPRNETDIVTNSNSDQRYSNHFYLIDMTALPSTSEITMVATRNAGTAVDIDLILYKDGYHFTRDCTTDANNNCTSYSKKTSEEMLRSDRSIAATPSTSYSKKIQTLDLLSTSSYYILNIRAYTANISILPTTEYTYTLTDQTGAHLCPSPTF
jgi:hypothetical protein